MSKSLIIPPSLKNIAKRISIEPPPNSSPPPPLWMLKYFPRFFVKEEGSKKPPHGVVGVYAYITTAALCFGLCTAHFYERFFTDNLDKSNAIIKDRNLMESKFFRNIFNSEKES